LELELGLVLVRVLELVLGQALAKELGPGWVRVLAQVLAKE
jgi:hypothetical protein